MRSFSGGPYGNLIPYGRSFAIEYDVSAHFLGDPNPGNLIPCGGSFSTGFHGVVRSFSGGSYGNFIGAFSIRSSSLGHFLWIVLFFPDLLRDASSPTARFRLGHTETSILFCPETGRGSSYFWVNFCRYFSALDEFVKDWHCSREYCVRCNDRIYLSIIQYVTWTKFLTRLHAPSSSHGGSRSNGAWYDRLSSIASKVLAWRVRGVDVGWDYYFEDMKRQHHYIIWN
jgi:hypothetical protein